MHDVIAEVSLLLFSSTVEDRALIEEVHPSDLVDVLEAQWSGEPAEELGPTRQSRTRTEAGTEEDHEVASSGSTAELIGCGADSVGQFPGHSPGPSILLSCGERVGISSHQHHIDRVLAGEPVQAVEQGGDGLALPVGVPPGTDPDHGECD
ncbi:MAG: hypothetical protein KGR18_11085 [Acidobacteria bacterium]|nr:hypothetical protein [Acidobacteriota bacterium]